MNSKTKRILIFVGIGFAICAIIGVVVGVTVSKDNNHPNGVLNGGAKVGVQFRNVGNSTSNKRDISFIAPTFFAMKFIAIYLAEDIDPQTGNNIGQTQMIYVNPQCENDISNCGIKDEKHLITDYFDFSLPGAEVNAILNSQQLSVNPGNYHYIRLEFCKYLGGQNIQFMAGNMTEPFAYGEASCVTNSERKDPPLVVNEGDNVLVQIDYNLNGTVFVYPSFPGANSCFEYYCFGLPKFIPSAIVSA